MKIMKLIRDHILNTLKVSLIFWFRFTTLLDQQLILQMLIYLLILRMLLALVLSSTILSMTENWTTSSQTKIG